MTKQITPKNYNEALKLLALVEAFLLTKGGTPRAKLGYPWQVPTKFGNFLVSVGLVSPHLTVFGLFEEPQRAQDKLGTCSPTPYSGKFNHQGGSASKGETAENVFSEWKVKMSSVFG